MFAVDFVSALMGWGFVALLVLAFLRRFRRPAGGTAFGSARWAEDRDLAKAGMFVPERLPLGRTLSGSPIWMHRYTHLAVFAPTGAGKGVSFLIVWLLSYARGSLVVIDPKGELWATTAKARQAMGQRAIRLDPFGVCGPGSETWNPLSLMEDGDGCVDDAWAFAEATVGAGDGGGVPRRRDGRDGVFDVEVSHEREDPENLDDGELACQHVGEGGEQGPGGRGQLFGTERQGLACQRHG